MSADLQAPGPHDIPNSSRCLSFALLSLQLWKLSQKYLCLAYRYTDSDVRVQFTITYTIVGRIGDKAAKNLPQMWA